MTDNGTPPPGTPNPEPSRNSISDSLTGLSGDMAEARGDRAGIAAALSADRRETAHAMIVLADSNRMIADRLPTRRQMVLAKVTIAIQTIIIAALAVVVALILLGQNDGHKTLGLIQKATSPASQAAGAKNLNHDVSCIEISLGNDILAVFDMPLKPVPKNCPSAG